MSTNVYSRLRANMLLVAVGRSIAPLARFLVALLIIKRLSICEYGIYSILLAAIAYLDIATSLGLPSICQRFIPEMREMGHGGSISLLVRRGLLWRGILAASALAGVMFFSAEISALLRVMDFSLYFGIFALGIFFFLEVQILREVLGALFLNRHEQLASIVYYILRLALVYGGLQTGHGLIGLLISETLAYALLLTMYLSLYSWLFAVKHSGTSGRALGTARMARFGVTSYLNEVGVTILSTSTDFLVLASFLGPAAVAAYAFANRLMQALIAWMPHNLLLGLIRPAFFTKYVQNGDARVLQDSFRLLTKLITFFAFPLAVGILVLADALILFIFGEKYLGAAQLLIIIAMFTSLGTLIMPIGLVLQAIEKPEVILASKAFAVYNLIGDFLVVRPYGLMGVAVVTGSAVLMQTVFCFAFAHKYAKVMPDWRGTAASALNALIMGLCLMAMRGFIAGLLSLAVVLCAGAGIYLLTSCVNRAFSDAERATLNRVIGRPVFPF